MAGLAVGNEANPAKRLGCACIASANLSFASVAIAIAVSPSNASQPGIVSDTTCTSIPAASIAANRESPRFNNSAEMSYPR